MNNGYYGTRSFPMAEAIHYVRQLGAEIDHWVGRIEVALDEAHLDIQADVSDTLRRSAREIAELELLIWAESQRIMAEEDAEGRT